MKFFKKPIILAVLIVTIILAVANSTTFFVGMIERPQGTVFLGTVHYPVDYFFYLNHFFQGAHGAWLTVNRYTTEATSASIIYWPNVMLGKIGGLFMFSHIFTYNLSILLLSTVAIFLSFVFLTRIFPEQPTLVFYAFLLGNFATSLINHIRLPEGGSTWWPFQIWKTPHFVFGRLGGAPQEIIQTILAYLFFITLTVIPSRARSRKTLIALPVIILVLLTSINPIQSMYFVAILWGTLVVYGIIHKSLPGTWRFLQTVTLTIATVIVFLYISNILYGLPHLQSIIWEASQDSYTTIHFLLLSIGPIVPLAVIGFVSRLKKLTMIEIFGALLVVSGYVLFMSRIPQMVGFSNLRILFPASYVFWGLFAAYGIQWLSKKTAQIIHIRADVAVRILLVLYLAICLPTVIWEIVQKLPTNNAKNDPIMYLPANIYSGFSYLSTQKPFDDIVIANPDSYMDFLVPALSGHTTYSGHMLATINNDAKQADVRRLFAGDITDSEAVNWLKLNRIAYVIFTRYDGDRVRFEAQYPQLIKIYANREVAVYRTGL